MNTPINPIGTTPLAQDVEALQALHPNNQPAQIAHINQHTNSIHGELNGIRITLAPHDRAPIQQRMNTLNANYTAVASSSTPEMFANRAHTALAHLHAASNFVTAHNAHQPPAAHHHAAANLSDDEEDPLSDGSQGTHTTGESDRTSGSEGDPHAQVHPI